MNDVRRYHAPPGWEQLGEATIPGGETLPLYVRTGEGHGGEVAFGRFAVQVDSDLYCIDATNGTNVRYSGVGIVSIKFDPDYTTPDEVRLSTYQETNHDREEEDDDRP